MRSTIFISIILSLTTTGAALADVVFGENVILDSSSSGTGNDRMCIGDDCVNGETFSSDFVKLKLKDQSVSIQFDDVSTTDPSWELIANPTPDNTFDIREIGGAGIFRIKDDAPANSLFISRYGNVGIGTALPESGLHVYQNGLAALRLQSANLAGDWNINAGSSGLFFTDKNSTASPVIFYNSAPDSSLVVAPNGNVGVGLFNPDVPLHVVENAGTATDVMRLENNGGVVFRLKDTSPGGQEFTFQSNGGIFRIASPAVPGPEFTMDDNGNVTIKGTITTIGVCNVGCDRVFDEDYDLRPLPEHNALMWEKGHLPAVGPTAEDGPMNLSDKVGGMLNELEHAHIYIGQLHDEIDQLKRDHASELAALETRQQERINAILSRLSALESD